MACKLVLLRGRLSMFRLPRQCRIHFSGLADIHEHEPFCISVLWFPATIEHVLWRCSVPDAETTQSQFVSLACLVVKPFRRQLKRNDEHCCGNSDNNESRTGQTSRRWKLVPM